MKTPRLLHVFLLSLNFIAPAVPSLIGIPTVPFEVLADGTYSIGDIQSLIVDSKYVDSKDEKGETLIPPTLKEFAQTFANDLQSSLDINVDVLIADEGSTDSIFLTLGDPTDYVDASGSETSEGYALSVSKSGIVITGASPLGVWWGTRTVLQQAIISDGSLPYGEGVDSPGWGIRGMMLDAGRHYYPPEFVKEICAYMSFFKQNTFHLHLSDNFNINTNLYSREFSLELFARFRLWSDSEVVSGLNKYKNESYTREQFEGIQSVCAARGVTILPEIEAPGHALVIVQWKPELGLADDLSLLNISHPDTIPTMKTIWHEFLPWFHSKTVHIGADEYTAGASEYNRFVNEMASFIADDAGKAIRIWGTFPPNPEYDNIDTAVSIEHWAFWEGNPYYDYILNNFSVLNSDDSYYVVNKWSASYPQTINISRTFHGDPSTRGFWYPNIFDQNNATNNPDKSNVLVLGGVTPLWNDYGYNASVYSEAYYAWRDGIPALADKQWGGDLTESDFPSVFATLHPKIPAQNLDRSISSKTPTVFNYTFKLSEPLTLASVGIVETYTMILDASGNDYHALTNCPLTADGNLKISPSCFLKTPLESKGRDYTLKLTVRVDELMEPTNATLISGTDSALMLTPNITFFASGNYYRLNSTIPLGTWVDLTIVGKGSRTFATVKSLQDNSPTSQLSKKADGIMEEFLAILGVLGQFFVWAPMAIETPLSVIGGKDSGWTGQLAAMSLSSEA